MKAVSDTEKKTNLKITADADQAKQTLNEVSALADSVRSKIDRAFNTMNSNNGVLSNRQVAGVESGVGQLNDLQNALRDELDRAKINQTPQQYSQTQANIVPQLSAITQELKKLNSSKLNAIGGATTTSSRAWRMDSITDPNGNTTNYQASNIQTTAEMRNLKSDINSFLSGVRKTNNSWSSAQKVGSVSYNRYQEYVGTAKSQQAEYDRLNNIFNNPKRNDPNNKNFYDRFQDQFKAVRQQSAQANQVASSTDATSAQVKYARQLDEQVKTMQKLDQQFKEMQAKLQTGQERMNTLGKDIGTANGVEVGVDPNSFQEILKQRAYSIARGAIFGGIAAGTSAISQGNNLRLGSFDDIKSTAYANGGRDNRVMNTLGRYGYRYGYSGADMAGFVNAYTGTTGNTGSINDVARAAQTWARQSRVTGGTQQSTQALEAAAGNATNLNPSQMSRLGNDITNSIINSNMSAKATEQQQGLASLYQNGARYEMTASDERNMAGFQASMAKYGNQFQGQQGAQNTQALTSTLGNFNNQNMRMVFNQVNPGRYNGVVGQARMLEDMQNLNKQPWKSRDFLRQINRNHGGNLEMSAYDLSMSSGGSITMDQAKKWIRASENGDMNESQFKKYIKTTQRSGKGADDTFNKTGASKLMKYNASLANSAMKASQALDGFAKLLAGFNQHSGPFGAAASSILSGVSSGVISSVLSGVITGGRLKGSGKLLGKIFGHGGGKGAEEAAEGAVKGGSRFSRVRGVAGRAVTKSRGLLSRGASLLRGSGKLGKVGSLAMRGAKAVGRSTGIGDVLLSGLDLAGAFSSTRKGTRARHRAVGSSVGSSAGAIAGGVLGGFLGPLGAVAGSALGGWLGSKAGNAIGGLFGTTRKARAMGKARGQSLSEARKTARRYNNAERGGLRLGKKGLLIGAGIAGGAAGLGLLGMGLTAHASTRKGSPQSEDWKILRGYNKMLDHAMRVVQAAKSIKLGGDDNKDAGDVDDDGASKDREHWKKKIKQVAKAMHQSISDDQVDKLLGTIQGESGFDEKAIGGNDGLSDGNAKGLLQFKQGTFDHYKAKGHDNIMSGVDQLYAFFNIKNWAQYATGHAGWSPSGPTNGYELGGIRNHATGGSFLADQPTGVGTNDVYGEAGTEAYTPLNAGHYNDGLSNLKDLAGMFGKQVVDTTEIGSRRQTTINPSYNINLTIKGGTDDANNLAQVVANKVREMLNQYDQQQSMNNQHAYFGNETSGLFV